MMLATSGFGTKLTSLMREAKSAFEGKADVGPVCSDVA